MNLPLPQSRFGEKFRENYDRIFKMFTFEDLISKLKPTDNDLDTIEKLHAILSQYGQVPSKDGDTWYTALSKIYECVKVMEQKIKENK